MTSVPAAAFHHRPEPPPRLHQRGWRLAEAVFALAIAIAAGYLTGDLYFLLGLAGYSLATTALYRRAEKCLKPLLVVVEGGQIRVTQSRFWSSKPATQSWPLAEFKAVLSHHDPNTLPRTGSVRTVLLHQRVYRTPLLLDEHDGALKRVGWRKVPVADATSAAELRLALAHASGLPDLGFVGTCTTAQLASPQFLKAHWPPHTHPAEPAPPEV